MPATIDVRAKREAWKGGPKLWNAVVYGPQEVFDAHPQMQRSLMRQGFTLKHANDGNALWTIPAVAVSPPLYLADILFFKHKVRPTVATKDMLVAARDISRPADDLSRFIGDGVITAGRQNLKVETGAGRFIANCDHDHDARIHYLAGAGFIPLSDRDLNDKIIARFGTRPYVTMDPIIASNLHGHMTSTAASVMLESMKLATGKFHASRIKTAPEEFSVPAPEGLDYLDFQKSGIKSVLDGGRSAIIADSMGLGKTIQAIGVINGRTDFTKILVTCQANMKYKWADELRKWMIRQDLTIGIAEGSKFPDTDIVIINYDIADRHRPNLQARTWDLVVNDEFHNMANHESKRTRAIYGDVVGLDPEHPPVKVRKGGMFLPLSGTPKPNEVTDLWPALTTVRPDIWGRGPEAYKAFQMRYQPPRPMRVKKKRGNHEYEVTIQARGTPMRETELHLRLRASGMIRREAGVTPMPSKFRCPLRLPFNLSEEDRRAMAQIDTDIEALAHRVAVENGTIRAGEKLPASAVIDIVTGIQPSSPHFSEGARVRANLGLLKAPYIARHIVERLYRDQDLAFEDREKLVVFAHHKSVISCIAEIIRADFPDAVIIYDGSVGSAAKKKKLVEIFQEETSPRVFLMSKSGNSGITLTAANRMIMAEGDWDPTNLAQIEDRIWRIGQQKACTIEYAFVPDSYDINIGNTVVRKMVTDERILNNIDLNPRGRQVSGGIGDVFNQITEVSDGLVALEDVEAETKKIEDNPVQMRMDL